MNKTKLTAALVLGGAAFVTFYLRRHETIIVKRFPDLDPTQVREVYRIMMKRALTDPKFDTDGFTEEQMDRVFLDLFKEIHSK